MPPCFCVNIPHSSTLLNHRLLRIISLNETNPLLFFPLQHFPSFFFLIHFLSCLQICMRFLLLTDFTFLQFFRPVFFSMFFIFLLKIISPKWKIKTKNRMNTAWGRKWAIKIFTLYAPDLPTKIRTLFLYQVCNNS